MPEKINFSRYTDVIHNISMGIPNFSDTDFTEIGKILGKTRDILVGLGYVDKKYMTSNGREQSFSHSTYPKKNESEKFVKAKSFAFYFDINFDSNTKCGGGLGFSLYDFVTEYIGGTSEKPAIIPWRLLIFGPPQKLIDRIRKRKLEDEIHWIGNDGMCYPFLRIDNTCLPHNLNNDPDAYAQQLADAVCQFVDDNFKFKV